jgi:DNA-binding LacI/PurR family transcriptional regulator
VGIDNHRAGYLLTEHLINSGSRRIAFLARPNSAHTVNVRIGGYHAALLAHFGPATRPLVQLANPSDIPAIQTFLRRVRPDAILCANDYTAAQLLTSLNTLGVQVPSQIRVAGMDDVKYARLLQTPLTTIHQPCREIGATALQAMLHRIANPSAPSRDYLVNFNLIVRRSTDANSDKLPEISLLEDETSDSELSATNSRSARAMA